MVVGCLPDTPVSPCSLATLEFKQGAMKAYEEHIKRSQKVTEIHASVSIMCSTMRMFPLRRGGQTENPSKNPLAGHAGSPLLIALHGRASRSRKWSMEKCQNGSSSLLLQNAKVG